MHMTELNLLELVVTLDKVEVRELDVSARSRHFHPATRTTKTANDDFRYKSSHVRATVAREIVRCFQ